MTLEEFTATIKEKYLAENEVILKGYYYHYCPIGDKKIKDANDLIIITNKRLFQLFHFSSTFQPSHLSNTFSFCLINHVISMSFIPQYEKSELALIAIGYDTGGTSHLGFLHEPEAEEAFQLIAKNMPL